MVTKETTSFEHMQVRCQTDRKHFLNLFNKNQKLKFSSKVFEELYGEQLYGGDFKLWRKAVLFPPASLSYYNEREASRCFTNDWNASGTVKYSRGRIKRPVSLFNFR
jgi:hypothetical protein